MILSQSLIARGQVPKQSQIRIVKLDERTSLRVKRRFLDVANLHEDTQSLLKIAGIV
jgi:hypothetical protein